jgi:hypothetical protein
VRDALPTELQDQLLVINGLQKYGRDAFEPNFVYGLRDATMHFKDIPKIRFNPASRVPAVQ